MKKKKPHLNNEKGLSTIEALPLLVIFIILMKYGLGMFGIVHTAILHSIAARTYAFETFRNRADLSYFRENGSKASVEPLVYDETEIRYHSIQTEFPLGDDFQATERSIAMPPHSAPSGPPTSLDDHQNKIYSLRPRNRRVSVDPAWIMVGYGICLNANCGGYVK